MQTTTTRKATARRNDPSVKTLDVKKHLNRNVDTALGERVMKRLARNARKGVSGRMMTGTERDMACRLVAHGRARRVDVDGVWTYFPVGRFMPGHSLKT